MEETEKELSPKQLKKAEKKRKRREKKEKKWAKQRRLLFPANKKGLHKMPFMDFLRFIGYPIHRLLYPFKLYGNKKVGPGAYIYVGNHMNMFDIFYVAHTTKEGVHFLSKQSIMEAPVIGWIARKLGAIGAMRDGSDVRTIMEAMKVLRNGEKVSLFPEGTRNRGSGEEFLPFHGGAAIFAIKTKTPIIPFVICNRPRVFHMTHVVFGEPMELSEYYDKKVSPEEYAEAEEKLKNKLYEMRAEHRAMLAEKKNKKKKRKNDASDRSEK